MSVPDSEMNGIRAAFAEIGREKYFDELWPEIRKVKLGRIVKWTHTTGFSISVYATLGRVEVKTVMRGGRVRRATAWRPGVSAYDRARYLKYEFVRFDDAD